ncbi:O-antigen ligase [Shewanella sp. KT0246]|uniref:O-antigen ligase family protein n=1 Tax=Shewanella sp. KT0246 TaxID=2815912 RepID=UPI0021806131|nr:O-antigen ligase family protein [Shewanella sp. KT0246]
MNLKQYSVVMFALISGFILLGTVFSSQFIGLSGIGNEYDLKRILTITMMWLCSCSFCFVKKIEVLKLSNTSYKLFGIFLTLGIISALSSKHPFWGGIELANTLLLFTIFVIFCSCVRTIQFSVLLKGLYAFMLFFSVCIYLKYILFLIFSYADGQAFNIHGLVTGYVNVRFFNQLQVMIIPILLLPFFDEPLKRFKRISIVIISLHWMVLLQTEARGSILSLILSVTLVAYFLHIKQRRQLFCAFMQCLLIGISFWLVFIIMLPYWLMDSTNFQIRTGSSGRIDLWLYVLNAIPEKILLGFGPMSFVWAEGKPLFNAHPHNSVMQILYEYGAVTCFVAIVWVSSFCYRRLVNLRHSNDISSVPIIISVLSGLIYSLFSGVGVMPYAQLMFVFLLAVLISHEQKKLGELSIWWRVILCLLVSLMSCFMLMTYQHEELLPALYPRIWINGLISY